MRLLYIYENAQMSTMMQKLDMNRESKSLANAQADIMSFIDTNCIGAIMSLAIIRTRK